MQRKNKQDKQKGKGHSISHVYHDGSNTEDIETYTVTSKEQQKTYGRKVSIGKSQVEDFEEATETLSRMNLNGNTDENSEQKIDTSCDDGPTTIRAKITKFLKESIVSRRIQTYISKKPKIIVPKELKKKQGIKPKAIAQTKASSLANFYNKGQFYSRIA